jgi:hypothetical protein
MPFLKLEDILRPTTTPKQANFLNWFYSYFNVGGGVAHRTILNVEPLFYQGTTAGTEFLTYAATKLYLILNIYFSGNDMNERGSSAFIEFHDQANAVSYLGLNISGIYNVNESPLTNYMINPFTIENAYFSRFIVTNSVYSLMIFNGYRITLN